MRQLHIDDLPKAGEPLRRELHETNQNLLDSDLSERIKKLSTRLTWYEHWKLNRRYKKLRAFLIANNYNYLVVKKYQAWRLYTQLKHLMKQSNHNKNHLRNRFLIVRAVGLELERQLDQIQPIADEHSEVTRKLKNHQDLLRWEQEDKENFNGFKREAVTWLEQIKAVFRQSPRLHHTWMDSKGNRRVDIPIIKQIIIKDDKVYFEIETTYQTFFGRFFGKWNSALPYGVDVANLISDETLQNLSTACNRIITVERSQRGTNLFYVISRLDAPDGIPKKVLYSKIIDWYPVEDHAKTPFCAGVTDDRRVKWYNFEDFPHVLIAGATQGGKSNFVNQMIATLTTMNTPEEVRLMLVDLKGGIEFTHWKGVNHQINDMLTTPDKVLSGLNWLVNIMESRLEIFEKAKAKNLTSFNATHEKIPRLFLFVDEMATITGLGQMTTEIHNALRVLSSQGRAVGIHLVIATQHPSVDVLPGWVKTNFLLRISVKMPTHHASMIILDTVTASTLPDVAGRIVVSSGRHEHICQSPFITDEQIEQAVSLSKEFKKPDDSTLLSLIPVQKTDDLTDEEIIRLSVQLTDGILSATRLHQSLEDPPMSRRKLASRIKELIKTIKDSGGLYVDGILYHTERDRNYTKLVVDYQPANQQDKQYTDGMVAG